MLKKKLFLLAMIILFLIGGLGISIRELVVKPFIKHDIALFDNEEYKEKMGGKDAYRFFSSIQADINGANRDFYILEGSKLMRFFHYCEAVYFLELQYNQDYSGYKKLINDKFIYLEDDLYTEDNNLIISSTFHKEEFYFSTVKEKDLNLYPSSFGMVGYNDSLKRVFLVFFYAPSLDYVGSMKEFIEINLPFIF